MTRVFGFSSFEPKLSKWDINEDIHSKLSKDVLEKIYSEAELRFNSTVDDISQIRGRAYSLIAIFISLLSILITLYFSDFIVQPGNEKKALVFLYFINISMIAYLIVQLVLVVFPNKIMLKGEEPKIMNYEVMASLSIETQNEIYLLNSIKAIQEKIEYNKAIISNKNLKLGRVIFIVTFMFVVTLIFELIIKNI